MSIFFVGCGTMGALAHGGIPKAQLFDFAGGNAMQAMPVQQPIFFKNPTVATLLSFFWSGLGQFYNGQIGKGIFMLVLYGVSLALTVVFIGFVTGAIVWIWGMLDANSSAKKINKRLVAGASPLQTAQ